MRERRAAAATDDASYSFLSYILIPTLLLLLASHRVESKKRFFVVLGCGSCTLRQAKGKMLGKSSCEFLEGFFEKVQ